MSTPGTMHRETVRWAELKPEEFLRLITERPVAYLPMGMVEPHGHAAAFGLDMIKADYLCDEAAKRFGGIVATSQTYTSMRRASTEPGSRRSWGDVNLRPGGLPPDVVMRSLLFQLRVCVNAGFHAVIVESGQNGAQDDLRLVADEFMKLVPVRVVVRSDPQLVRGTFPGGHAGRYEVSQLLYLRPDLVDMARLGRVASDPLGRFAQKPDAYEATAEYGKQVVETQIDRIGELASDAGLAPSDLTFLEFDDVEPAWTAVEQQRST
jgi:creatinine amidohydrolase